MTKSSRPRWEIQRAVAYGKEAQTLGQQCLKELEPRLGAGLMEGFSADLAQLEAMETGRPAKVDEVKGLTGSQRDIAEKAAAWASSIREAVKRRSDGDGLRKAVGVGRAIATNRVKPVATAIQTILAAAAERPDELRACGILESDLTRGRALLTSLGGASAVQDQGLIAKKDMTAAKNKIQLRVEAAIQAIATAGALQYHDADPALAQRFRGLIPPAIGNGGPASPAGDQPPAPEAAKI